MSDEFLPEDEYSTEELLEMLNKAMDKVPMEDTQYSQEAELFYLEPWEIQDITQEALGNLPEGLEEQVDLIFDVIYEAVSEGLARARRQLV
jgi:hypothetical protein